MKKCPECKNKGWKPSEGKLKPVGVDKTDDFGPFVRRYRSCLNCGYRWTTIESFEREVDKGEPDLFESSESV